MRMIVTPVRRGVSVPIETQREIIRLYLEDGLSVNGVAKRVYWSTGTCHAVLARQGVPRRSRGRRGLKPMSQERLDQVVTLYASGLSCAEVGDVLGVTHTTVLAWLRRAGVELRTPAKGASIRRAKDMPARRFAVLDAIEDAGEPVTANDIAIRLGARGPVVRHDMRRLHEIGLIEPIDENRTRAGRRWGRTDLPLDQLAAHLAGSRDESEPHTMLPTGPFVAWLEDYRRRNPDVVLGRRFGLDEAILRRIGRQQRMTLELADTILTRSRDHVFLWELWPELDGRERDVRENTVRKLNPRRPKPAPRSVAVGAYEKRARSVLRDAGRTAA